MKCRCWARISGWSSDRPNVGGASIVEPALGLRALFELFAQIARLVGAALVLGRLVLVERRIGQLALRRLALGLDDLELFGLVLVVMSWLEGSAARRAGISGAMDDRRVTDSSPIGLDHVQVAAPAGAEGDARRFYGELLGMTELPKPETLRGRGGVWFACGDHQLHVGVAEPFAPARKAHPALLVRRGDLDRLARRLAAAGCTMGTWDAAIPGTRRFYTADPGKPDRAGRGRGAAGSAARGGWVGPAVPGAAGAARDRGTVAEARGRFRGRVEPGRAGSESGQARERRG